MLPVPQSRNQQPMRPPAYSVLYTIICFLGMFFFLSWEGEGTALASLAAIGCAILAVIREKKDAIHTLIHERKVEKTPSNR